MLGMEKWLWSWKFTVAYYELDAAFICHLPATRSLCLNNSFAFWVTLRLKQRNSRNLHQTHSRALFCGIELRNSASSSLFRASSERWRRKVLWTRKAVKLRRKGCCFDLCIEASFDCGFQTFDELNTNRICCSKEEEEDCKFVTWKSLFKDNKCSKFRSCLN